MLESRSGPAADAGGPDTRHALLLIAGIALLRVVALKLNSTDLFFDESQYWAWSREPAFGYYSKPPLIAWIIAASTSLCGNGEVCVRLPAVLIHAGTAFAVFLLGRALYSGRIGLLSAAVYATLPGVSLSSGIISTDVPLLLAWALALLAFHRLLKAPDWRAVPLLGLAFGTGLNAKYAMAYFVLCAAVFLWLVPERREAAKRPHLWVALALGLALIVPNLVWNARHGFATFAHTADNAKWGGSLLHPLKALEFLGAQFGVFGPILFAALLVILWRVQRGKARFEAREKMLLAFSVPVIGIVTGQAFLSRAHPNWAAVAYVPATLLVTAYMLREGEERWFRRSLALNASVAVVIAAATWQAGKMALPGVGDPFARTLGNRELAAETRRILEEARRGGKPFGAIISDERELTASLLYYGREVETPLFAWRAGPRPADHFEMQRPYLAGAPEPVLLVTRKADPAGVTGAFARAEPLLARALPAGRFSTRTIHYFALSGYRAP
jgi:hypothetical protein